MTRFLVATDSVHTTAAACDYLQSRLDPDDEVVVVAVDEPGRDARDAGDAVNVARTRLATVTVDVVQREGDPETVVPELVADRDVDEVVVGPRRGTPDADDDLGGTVRTLLTTLDVPVVVVPLDV